MLVRALENAGLSYQDIETVYLPPADARVAFESGSVDAWCVWDPFYAVAESAGTTRVLVDGVNLVTNRAFYLASRKLTEEHPELIKILVAELATTSGLGLPALKQKPSRSISKSLGIEPAIVRRAEQRRHYGINKFDYPEIIADQQTVADTFARLGLIREKVDISSVIWQPALSQ